VVSAIRNNELGRNPFMCIIAITWNPTSDEVDKVINLGVDALLRAPLSPQQIFHRIHTMVHNRVPFIVTSDYVGPDRRKDPTRSSKIPLIAAPNTLRDKALGEWDPAAVRLAIETTFGDVRSQKLIRRAAEVARLADLMLAENSADGPDRARAYLERVHKLVGELDQEARNQGLEHICVLCQTALPVVESLRRSVNAYQSKDLELLKQLSLALRGATQPNESGASLIDDIAATVGGKN
jgi:hypothetical protein